MKRIILVLMFLSGVAYGQIYQTMPQSYKMPRLRTDSVLSIPLGIERLRNISGGQDTGQVRYNKADSSVYVYTGYGWVKPTGSGGSGTVTSVATTNGYAMLSSVSNPTAAANVLLAVDSAALSGKYIRRSDSSLYVTQTYFQNNIPTIDAVLRKGNTSLKTLQIGDGLFIKHDAPDSLYSAITVYGNTLTDNREFRLPDTTGIPIMSINGQLANSKGEITVGGSQGLQDAIIVDNVLTQDNTIEAAGYGLTFNDVQRLTFNTTEGFESGVSNDASGSQSASFGQNNTSSGSYSFTSGDNNDVSGSQAGALGQSNQSTGSNSWAIGANNIAAANQSIAIGDGVNTTGGNNSIGIGQSITNSGQYATLIGNGMSNSTNSIIKIGFGSISNFTVNNTNNLRNNTSLDSVAIFDTAGVLKQKYISSGATYTATLPLSINGGNVISMTRASATDSGYVTTGNQTIAGNKTFSGTTTLSTPFTLGATSVTSTGAQLNYLSGATGTTGTNTTNIVYSTSPQFTTGIGVGVAASGTYLIDASKAQAEMRLTSSTSTSRASYLLSNGGSGSTYFGIQNSAGNDYGITGGIAYASGVFNTGAKAIQMVTTSVARMSILSTGEIGISTSTPTAKLHISAGTATANTSPLKLTSGTNLTTAEAGAIEYNGTNIFFTPSSATRNNFLITASVNSVTPTLPNRTITVVIDGTTYYIHAKTTND